MGTLRKYELKTTRCKVFFETGTGLGHSLKHALDNGNFSRLYSSEIHEKTAERATDKFKHHPNVSIINSDSLSALHQVVPTIPKEEPILFFLDAHFPGEVEAGFDYQQNLPSDQTLPLEQELTLIDRLRPESEDVIIVDDLKLYENGDYANGNIASNFANIHDSLRNLKFLQNLFPNKVISRCYLDDGYLIIQPGDLNFKLTGLNTIYRIKRTILKNYVRILGV